MTSTETVVLARVLTQVRDRVTVDPAGDYTLCGVRGKAQGLFVREPQSGSTIKASTLLRIRSGQFIYNRLFAGNGSFALVPDEADGMHVSNEFPVFDVDSTRLDPDYLLLWFSQPEVWACVESQCVGSTQSRSRWKEQLLLRYAVPAPTLPEQQRITSVMRAVDHYASAQQAALDAAEAARDALVSRFVLEALGTSADVKRLDAVATWSKGRTPHATEEGPADDFVQYMTAVALRTGSPEAWVRQDDSRSVLAESRGALVLWDGASSGDVFECPGGVVASTMAWVRSTTEALDDGFLTLVLRHYSSRIKASSRGSTVPHVDGAVLAALPTPLPAPEVQDELVRAVDAADEHVRSAAEHLSVIAATREQMLADLLSGNHRVPESYDPVVGDAS